MERAQGDTFKNKKSIFPASQGLELIWLLHLHFTLGLNGHIPIEEMISSCHRHPKP